MMRMFWPGKRTYDPKNVKSLMPGLVELSPIATKLLAL
jgi:hypothetical protein